MKRGRGLGVCRITGLRSACSRFPLTWIAPPPRFVAQGGDSEKGTGELGPGPPVFPSLAPPEEGQDGLRMLLAGTSLALVPDDIPILLLPLASGKQALTGIIRLHGGKDAPGCLGSSHTIIFCLGWMLLGTCEHLGVVPIGSKIFMELFT